MKSENSYTIQAIKCRTSSPNKVHSPTAADAGALAGKIRNAKMKHCEKIRAAGKHKCLLCVAVDGRPQSFASSRDHARHEKTAKHVAAVKKAGASAYVGASVSADAGLAVDVNVEIAVDADAGIAAQENESLCLITGNDEAEMDKIALDEPWLFTEWW
jgi:hypothetical protein